MPRVSEIQRFQVQDLILKVKIDEKSARWDEARYENFLSVLCEDREYQKEAIKTALHYILDGYYPDLRALAEENWNINDILRERYKTWSNFERYLQLPDKLAASIDLATGTGKSYVMYGIAAILLAEGVVDSVLVLCPSTTIENELLKKFHILAGDTDLRELLPPDAIIRTPRIMSARDETITPGCICVENRDAVYEHVKSTSIKDSLYGKGTRVAVLNDETHHVANEVDEKKNRWKEFLENPEYGFRIVLGFSGTCYVRDDYFADVIYRYSLRDAMEQRFVKTVRYIAEEPTTGERDERWQLVYSKHQEIRRELQRRGIRPLTIVVTPNIRMYWTQKAGHNSK